MARQPVVYILASPNEKQIKKWRREKKVALIDSANPEWLDLSGEIA